MAKILDGKALADVIRAELKERVSASVAAGRRAPCLGVVLVGCRPDSATYVRSKKAACAQAGIVDKGIELPAEATQADVLAAVAGLNADPDVDGILVQLPLPPHIDERAVLEAIGLAKDADGLHPLNVGALALKGHTPMAVACTPKGCLELLKRSGVAIEGKRAVVLGRSNIVGIPMALLLLEQNATVTVCHSRTADLPSVIREVRKAWGRRAAVPARPRARKVHLYSPALPYFTFTLRRLTLSLPPLARPTLSRATGSSPRQWWWTWASTAWRTRARPGGTGWWGTATLRPASQCAPPSHPCPAAWGPSPLQCCCPTPATCTTAGWQRGSSAFVWAVAWYSFSFALFLSSSLLLSHYR